MICGVSGQGGGVLCRVGGPDPQEANEREMATPGHYPTTLAAIETALAGARRGSAWQLDRSAGGRTVAAIAYGEPEPVEALATCHRPWPRVRRGPSWRQRRTNYGW